MTIHQCPLVTENSYPSPAGKRGNESVGKSQCCPYGLLSGYLDCPVHYCDDDNDRVMFIRFAKHPFYDLNEKYSFDVYSQMYADAVLKKFDQLNDSSMVDYMESINKNLNPNKSYNYIFKPPN